jgi:hypothetical protein
MAAELYQVRETASLDGDELTKIPKISKLVIIK